MVNIELFLLFGQYSKEHFLGKKKKKTLSETVKNYQEYLPKYLPMPHPSPRNIKWFMDNPWFESEMLPVLKKEVKKHLNY
jgi:uracil-DNA glycosylase